MYMFKSVCIYIYIYVYIYVYRYLCVCVCMYIYTYICRNVGFCFFVFRIHTWRLLRFSNCL